ncbi:MAG: hypothetical protein ACRCYY_12475 [Trueperaceae bacterium]
MKYLTQCKIGHFKDLGVNAVTIRFLFRLIIYSLLLLTFCSGLPQLHYSVAIMIVLLIRHKDNPQALLRPVDSVKITLPWQKR